MTNTENNETYIPGTLHCRTPSDNSAPLVFDIPRSGSDYPREFQSPAKFDAVRRLISMYVEDLYRLVPDAGATWLYALFPNAYIDTLSGFLAIGTNRFSRPTNPFAVWD